MQQCLAPNTYKSLGSNKADHGVDDLILFRVLKSNWLCAAVILGIALSCSQTKTHKVQGSMVQVSTNFKNPGRWGLGDLSCTPPGPGPLFRAKPLEVLMPFKFGFLEGPVWSHETQSLFLSAWNPVAPTGGKGPPTSILEKTGASWKISSPSGLIRSNGLARDTGRGLVAALHDDRAIGRISPVDGRRQLLAAGFRGKPFNAPNDLVIRSDGNLYFTDPDYQNDGRSGQQPVTGVYRISPLGEVFLIDGQRREPNGITLSPDEKTLYVGSAEGVIFSYDLSPEGTVGTARVFARPKTGVDGMSVDCLGQVYAALYEKQELVVYPPGPLENGALEVIEIARVPLGYNITNVAFGGADQRTLYITTEGHLFQLESQVQGAAY